MSLGIRMGKKVEQGNDNGMQYQYKSIDLIPFFEDGRFVISFRFFFYNGVD